jgi:type I restriction enzyme S subunit
VSFPRYAEYKDSGIEWLGRLPEHWDIDRFKRSVSKCSNGIWGEEAEGNENDTVCVRVADFDRDRLEVAISQPTVRSITEREREGRLLSNGDLLLEKSGGGDNQPVGCVVLYRDATQAVCSNFIARMRLRPDMSPSFWRYVHAAAYAVRLNTKSIKQTSGLQNLDQQQYLDEYGPFPPLPEQIALAAFLDGETTKIDALIIEQRRLIDLLKEKRQGVISHAVTKGLDPDAPMKPSRVDWLREVPNHWAVEPIAARYSVQLGKMLDSSRITGQHLRPYLRVIDVQWGCISVQDLPEMDFDSVARAKFLLRTGDLLVNEGGSYPGRSAVWKGALTECYYQKALHRLRPHRPDRDTTSFFYYAMSWAADRGVFTAGGNETTIEHLPAEKLRRYRFAFPPITEQREISAFLDHTLERLNELVNEAECATELLYERRSALISAAVTGQIDVRGLIPSEAA